MLGSPAREEKLDNSGLPDNKERRVSRALQAGQEMSDPLDLLVLLDRQALLVPTGSKGTRGRLALESPVPEEREENQG